MLSEMKTAEGRQIEGDVVFSVPLSNEGMEVMNKCLECTHVMVCKYAVTLYELNKMNVLPIDFSRCLSYIGKDEKKEGNGCTNPAVGKKEAEQSIKKEHAKCKGECTTCGKDHANCQPESAPTSKSTMDVRGAFSFVQDSVAKTIDVLAEFLIDSGLTAGKVIMNPDVLHRFSVESNGGVRITKVETVFGVLPVEEVNMCSGVLLAPANA